MPQFPFASRYTGIGRPARSAAGDYPPMELCMPLAAIAMIRLAEHADQQTEVDRDTDDTGGVIPPIVDVGAYEYGGTNPQPCLADLNCD